MHRTGPVESTYKFIIGTVIGAHPVYGGHTRAAGTDNWGRFLTRWSLLVWHPHLQNIASEQAVVQISGNARIWDFLSKQAVLDANRRIEIVHLINPPKDDNIGAAVSATMEPAAGLAARYKERAGERLAGLYYVSPESLDAVPLQLNDEGAVILPPVALWVMLVTDLRGHYDVPQPRPQFTEPPDVQQVAEAMQGVGRISDVDPLRPEEQEHVATERNLRKNPAFNSWSVRHSPVSDPEARNGRAASYDADLGRGVIGSFFSDLPIGRYRATARIKVLNPARNTTILLHSNPGTISLCCSTFTEPHREPEQASCGAPETGPCSHSTVWEPDVWQSSAAAYSEKLRNPQSVSGTGKTGPPNSQKPCADAFHLTAEQQHKRTCNFWQLERKELN